MTVYAYCGDQLVAFRRFGNGHMCSHCGHVVRWLVW